MFLKSSSETVVLALACIGTGCVRLPAGAQTSPSADPMSVAATNIITQERDYSDVMDNLEYLSDQIGPRLTGSDRLKRANDWTAEKMKQYGLENVHLEAYTIPQGWMRGTASGHIVMPNGLPVSLAQMAWTPGIRGKVTGQVVVVNAQKEEDLDAYKGKLHGAVILMGRMPDDPSKAGALPLPDQVAPAPIPGLAVNKATDAKPAPPGRDGANFDRQKFMAFRKKLAEFEKQEGVAAILMDAGKPYGLLNMTGSWSSNSQIPTFFVAHEYVAMCQRLMHRNQTVTMELESSAHFVKGPVTVYNTVGEIRGSEKPDEVVLIGGHLDSWDLGTGSTDNGTGAMAVLEAAKLLKTSSLAPPKRTIRFVMFSGEEEGLFGSKAYVDSHKKDMDKFDVVFIHDTGTGRVKGLWLQNRAECKPLLESQFGMLKTAGLVTDEVSLLPGKMNGTDHASFDDAGVPAFAFNQEEANYGLNHHSQADTFDKARADDLKQGACVLAILSYNAAQMPDRYPRTQPVKP